MSMSTSIYLLTPEACARAQELVAALDRVGIKYKVTSTRRTTEEQIALYCQGRAPLEIVQILRQHAGMPKLHESENKYTVTKVDGVNRESEHQQGRAIDIAVLIEVERGEPKKKELLPTWNYMEYSREYRAIADLARRHGWNCGADWPPINPATGLGADPPHHQMKS
jgi:hypothetical protein